MATTQAMPILTVAQQLIVRRTATVTTKKVSAIVQTHTTTGKSIRTHCRAVFFFVRIRRCLHVELRVYHMCSLTQSLGFWSIVVATRRDCLRVGHQFQLMHIERYNVTKSRRLHTFLDSYVHCLSSYVHPFGGYRQSMCVVMKLSIFTSLCHSPVMHACRVCAPLAFVCIHSHLCTCECIDLLNLFRIDLYCCDP